GDPEYVLLVEQGGGAGGERVEGERQLLGVEAVDAGRVAFGVDRDEQQRAADADGRLHVAAIGQRLNGGAHDPTFSGEACSSGCFLRMRVTATRQASCSLRPRDTMNSSSSGSTP